MNAISSLAASLPAHKPLSPPVPPAPAVPDPAAAAITLSPQAQKALSLIQPQPNNVIWGSGPSR